MTDNREMSSADVDPTDGRDESLNERMDRNWNEILQELRVTQTGTQIFTGFLLTIAFQTRFTELTTFQVRVYLALVVAAVLTTAFGLAREPAPQLVPQGRKDDHRGDSARLHADHAGGGRGDVDRHGAVDLRSGGRSSCRVHRRGGDAAGRDHPCGAASSPSVWPAAEIGPRSAEETIMPGKKKPGPSVKDDKVYEAFAMKAGQRRRRLASPTHRQRRAAPRLARRAASQARTTTGRSKTCESGPRSWACLATPQEKSELVSMLRNR